MKKPVEKIKKFPRVYYDLDDCFPIEIDDLIAYLVEAKQAGATKISFEYTVDNFDEYAGLEQAVLVYKEPARLETDAEFNERVAEWEKYERELEAKEKAEFKRLQQKYSES